MDKKDVTPLFVNGELNLGKKRVESKEPNFKEPKKKPFADFILTLIGVALVGFGIYTFVNKDSDNKNNKESNSNITSNETSNKKEKKIDYLKNFQLGSIENKNIYSTEDIQAMNSVEGLNVTNMSNNAKLALASKIATEVDRDGKKYITDEEMDLCIKTLFGDINYMKSSFIRGKYTYTYNQETKMYYLMSTSDTTVNYSKYDHSISKSENNTYKVIDYVLFTDNTKSWTLNDVVINDVVTKDNMLEKLNTLKSYIYTYNVVDEKYYLVNIAIK